MSRMDIKKRRQRFRYRIKYLTKRPRLSVHKSNRYIYAQLIEQFTGNILASYDSKRLLRDDVKAKDLKGVQKAYEVGRRLGELILKKGIKQIVFDKSGYKYHGQVKALAEGLREAGLDF